MGRASTGNVGSASNGEFGARASGQQYVNASKSRRTPGLAERVAVLGSGVVSIVVLIAVLAGQPRTWTPPPELPPIATERGDPLVAAELAEQAQAEIDRRQALRLLIAASVVAPERVEHRIAVASALLAQVKPQRITGGSLGTGAVRYATLSSEGSFVVVDRDDGGQLWQLFGYDTLFQKAYDFGQGISGAAAGEHSFETTIVVAGADGIRVWAAARTSYGSELRHVERIADRADAITIDRDGAVAVTVDGSSATLWDVGSISIMTKPVTAIAYNQPVTSLDLPASERLLLAAGHDNGSATLDLLNRDRNSSVRQTLTGAGAPIDTLTVSANGATALAVGEDGTLTVWRPTITDAAAHSAIDPSGTASAGRTGPFGAWLSPDGTYALISSSSAPAAVWSLADPAQPAKILDLGVGVDPAVPAMMTADGRTLVTIDQDHTLTAWSTATLVDTLNDPMTSACQDAAMTEQAWRQIVTDPAYANPCAGEDGLPTIDVHTGPTTTPDTD